jgi:hypothetical protein
MSQCQSEDSKCEYKARSNPKKDVCKFILSYSQLYTHPKQYRIESIQSKQTNQSVSTSVPDP